MVPIQSALLCRAIASSVPTAPSPGTGAAWSENAGFWSTKGHTQERFIFSVTKFSVTKFGVSENEWVAQVSLLRPGFLLAISPGRQFIPALSPSLWNQRRLPHVERNMRGSAEQNRKSIA